MDKPNLRWPDDPTRQAPPYSRVYGGAGPSQTPLGGAADIDAALALRRLLARVIDWLFLLLATSPIWVPILRPLAQEIDEWVAAIPPGTTRVPPPPADLTTQIGSRGYQVSLLWALTGFVYETVLYALWGQTLGKLVAGIRVVRLADRQRVGWGAAAARAGVYRFPSLVPFGFLFWLANVTWLLWDRPNWQCLHDKAAQTVVVRARRRPA